MNINFLFTNINFLWTSIFNEPKFSLNNDFLGTIIFYEHQFSLKNYNEQIFERTVFFDYFILYVSSHIYKHKDYYNY